MNTPPLRVLAVPADHPYSRHIRDSLHIPASRPIPASRHIPAEGDRPPVDVAPPGNWWPPKEIDSHWVTAHSGEFDLMHLHFGVESFSLDHLKETVTALRRKTRPLVYTVHDLSNPQLADQTPHLRQLELLVGAATALITLTPGAAAQINQRFGRDATVIPHPHVLPLDVLPPDATPRPAAPHPGVAAVRQTVIGLSLKDFRPNVDAVGVTATLLAAVRELRSRGTLLRVIIDHQPRVRDDAAFAEVRRLVANAGDIATVWEHDRLTDSELFAFLNGLDVCVLPYRHGTHSGWLELCWDLGVAVVAPRVGYFAEQHPESGEIAAFDLGGSDSLAAALSAVLASPDATAPGTFARAKTQARRREVRRRQRAQIAEQHLAVYRSALAAKVR